MQKLKKTALDLSSHSELLDVAKNCVWFKKPEQALKYPEHFVAHVLTYGTYDDVKKLRKVLGDDGLRYCLNNAPPGIFDKKSWEYWRLILELPSMPLPGRECLADAEKTID